MGGVAVLAMTLQPMALFDVHMPTFDKANMTVRETNHLTAAEWCGRYHYTRTPGTVNATHYGAFAPDLMATVSIGYAANEHGVAKRLGLTSWQGNREITRVACHPLAPRNTASRVIAAVCGLHHEATGDLWLFSYADTGAGHHGGIYQALNAAYVGMTEPRPGFILDGRPTHPRAIVHKFGTQAWPVCRDIAKARGMTLERVADMNTPKHAYVLAVGDRRSRRAIRKALEPFVLPYPKRAK